MSTVDTDGATPEAALTALREANPDALLAALGEDGFRVSMPESVEVPPEYAIPVPPNRQSMVDLVVPEDRLAVVTTWERALRHGVGIGVVHLPSDPERAYSLGIFDRRDRYGVWIASLTVGSETGVRTDSVLADSLVIPTRPRTATMHKSMLAVITEVDERTTQMLGWSADQMVGHRSTEFMHPDDHERAIGAWMEVISTFETGRVRVRHLCVDGSWLWVEIENTYHHHPDPELISVECQVSDIADEMAAYQALHQREQLFHRLTESLPTGVFQVDAERAIVFVNGRLGEILGLPAATTVEEQCSTVVDDDRAAVAAAIEAVLEDRIEAELEVGIRHPGTGELRRCTMSFVAVDSGAETPGALVCVNDVTDSARMREELKIKATYDALTGCYNRSSVMTALAEALGEDDGMTAVVFVDLDQFKPINDTLGHAAGDDLLVETARRLRQHLRSTDCIGRIGGDEFLVVCRSVKHRAEALAIAERAQRAFDEPIVLPSGTAALRASIGLAVSQEGVTSDCLVSWADAAMYVSKREGQGRVVAFEPGMLAHERPTAEALLHG